MKMEVLADPRLSEIAFIEHGFFTRNGGVSQGAYSSLNCSFYQDDRAVVKENRRRAMLFIGKDPTHLVTFTDMHSNTAIIVEQPWDADKIVNADGMVTKNKNIVLGALCADCPLILFADEYSKVIGIAHAGWRGAKAGIIESTLDKMLLLGSEPENIVATIGPCIAQDSYEIGPEVYNQFLADELNNKVYFKPSIKAEHFMFDLRQYVCDKLRKLRVKQITHVNMDTYKEEDLFFSRRRSYHNGEYGYGCQLGFICLK